MDILTIKSYTKNQFEGGKSIAQIYISIKGVLELSSLEYFIDTATGVGLTSYAYCTLDSLSYMLPCVLIFQNAMYNLTDVVEKPNRKGVRELHIVMTDELGTQNVICLVVKRYKAYGSST